MITQQLTSNELREIELNKLIEIKKGEVSTAQEAYDDALANKELMEDELDRLEIEKMGLDTGLTQEEIDAQSEAVNSNISLEREQK